MLKQKFRRGNLVNIKYGSNRFDSAQGKNAIILGSYDEFYGTGNIFEYSIMIQESGSKRSWYHDNSLVLIDEGGEHLIEQAIEKIVRSKAENVLLNENLNDLSDDDIVTLLRFIGFDYSIGNNYFAMWDRILPLFNEICEATDPNLLKGQYSNYDIEGVWNIVHK